jgi:LysM repeat protein
MTPRIQFDFSSIDPRHRALIIGGIVVIVLAVVGLIFFRPGAGDETADLTVTPTVSPTASPSVMPTAGLPTETPTQGPTPTLEPYTYTIQAEDTLYFIIQQFGYRDLAVIPEVLRLNGMATENDPLVAGQTLRGPRQTATVGPTFTVTSTLDPLVTPTATGTPGPTTDPNITQDLSECTPEKRCPSPDGNYWIHIVRAGDTIAAIAFQYDSTVDCLLRENGLPPDPVIFEGQQIKVCILVTLTPTLTPTGGPDSTATALPTPSAPSLLAPAQNASIAKSQTVTLQWAGSRPLNAGQSYLIVLKNVDTGEETRYITRASARKLPASLKAGQYEWRVVIVNGNSVDSPVVSGPGETRRFSWR